MAERSAAAPRAVVFDLDDTLFDAFGQCVAPAHAEAAAAMCAAGLEAPLAAVLARRWELAGRTDDLDLAVARTFATRDVPRAARAGRDAFLRRDPGPVTPFPFARPVLMAVREVASSLLLTAGDRETQATKVQRLGFVDALDDVLVVEPDAIGGKRPTLARWIAARGLEPWCVLVVGDRPSSEIAAALALGCRVLRIRGGECAAEPSPLGVPEAPDVRAVLRYL